MKNKYLYLLKNMGLLTISNLGGRMLSFFLTPLYTSILTTSEYGTYDLYTTTIFLLAPILSVSISDAVLRFSLDKNNSKSDICTVGLRSIVMSIVIFTVLVFINYYYNIIPVLNQYPIYLILYFVGDRIYNYLSSVAKGIDEIKGFAISGLLNSASTFLLNILFLVLFKLGISGYFLANILAFFISIFYLSIKIKLNKYISLHLKSKGISKDMKSYSRPLIINSISWWINNSLDRYIIIWLLGTSENGIYSVAYKIPTIINVVQAIFNQAWTLSAVKEFDDKKSDFYSNTYKAYNLILAFACSILIIFDQLIAKLIYSNDFYIAWKYVPFLLISAMFAALNAFLDSIFAANMDSKQVAKATVTGAIINAILNIILIHFIGTVGAAIATMVSYFCMWIIKHIKISKVVELGSNMVKAFSTYAILLAQAVIIFAVQNIWTKHIIAVLLFVILMLLNIREIKAIANKVKAIIKNKLSKSEG